MILLLKFFKNSQCFTIKGEIDLSELKYPAMTVCSKNSVKYALAERLGNYLDPDQDLPEEFISMRNEFLKCAAGMEYEDINAKDQQKLCLDAKKTRRKRFSLSEIKPPKPNTKLALGCKVNNSI